MFKIRNYSKADYAIIKSWWDVHKQPAPLEHMMIPNGTFVLEIAGQPVMTLTALMTQSKEISFLEGFCSKPGLDKAIRNKAAETLTKFCFRWLKDHKYERVMCFTDNQKLISRYQQLGMSRLMNHLTVLGRKL
jgi:hypothetical protein